MTTGVTGAMPGAANPPIKESTKGYTAAIVVGSVAIIAITAFAAVAFLQAYGVISLPPSVQWLSSALQSVAGPNPPFIKLILLEGGGFVFGSPLIIYGAVGKHKEAAAKQKALVQQTIETSVCHLAYNNEAGETTIGKLEYQLWYQKLPLEPNFDANNRLRRFRNIYLLIKTPEDVLKWSGFVETEWGSDQERQRIRLWLEEMARHGDYRPDVEYCLTEEGST
jgi:hypothetical protein